MGFETDRLASVTSQLCIEHTVACGRRFKHLSRDDLVAAYIAHLGSLLLRDDPAAFSLHQELAGELALRGEPSPAEASFAIQALFDANRRLATAEFQDQVLRRYVLGDS